MGADRAHMPAPKGPGRPRIAPLRGVVDALLYICARLVRGAAAARFSEPLDSAALFLHVVDRRSVGTGQFPAGPAFSGTGRPRGQPLGWRDRQPVGQNHRKFPPSHVPSHPQTAAKVRGFSPIASGFTAETDWLLERSGFEP